MAGAIDTGEGGAVGPLHQGAVDGSRPVSAFVWVAIVILNLLALVLAGFGMWYHGIGHVSMDSSMQLYEAYLGRSVTWNPPSMSAILRWLGPGPTGSARMVALNSAMTFLSFGIVASALLLDRAERTLVRVPWAISGILVPLVVLLNPVLMAYVGIVWKDVLFSSLMLAGASLGLIAAVRQGPAMWLLALGSAVVLGVGMKVRQHGIFMAPVLLLVPVFAVSWGRDLPKTRALLRAAMIVLAFVLAVVSMRAAVSKTIDTPTQYGDAIGYRGIMMYDIAGTLTYSRTPTRDLPFEVPEQMREEARRIYTPDRGDYLTRSPQLMQWMTGEGDALLRQRWMALARAEFPAFVRHKFAVWSSILDINGVEACLPVHVGIDGNLENLRQIGFEPGQDARDRAIYGYSRMILDWPIFRHFAYLGALLAGLVLLPFLRMPVRLKLGASSVAAAAGLLYLSYLPASVACDFRYLYAAICLVSRFWIVLATSAYGLKNPLAHGRDRAA